MRLFLYFDPKLYRVQCTEIEGLGIRMSMELYVKKVAQDKAGLWLYGAKLSDPLCLCYWISWKGNFRGDSDSSYTVSY